MAKVTMATVKSFINKNFDDLFIKNKSTFDGMIDGVRSCKEQEFRKVVADGYKKGDNWFPRTLGINGAWFVGESRDYITPFERDGFKGFEIWNSCGSFEIAVKL